MSVIRYLSGGLLGDFIHQLSVINEKYLETGKKGVLYIANIGDNFRNGLQKTYDDLYELVILQEYIEEFKIYNNEEYDINLSTWRTYSGHNNLSYVFKIIYNIEFGKHRWLNNLIKLDEWSNKTIVNTVKYRFPDKEFFDPLKNTDLTNYCFVSIFKDEYEYFIKQTGLNINYYSPNSLLELCIILNSCEKVIGSLSAVLSISTSLHKNSFYGIDSSCPYIYFFENIKLPYVQYKINC